MNNKSQKMNILLVFLFEMIILAGIYLTSLYSFLVFHSIVELFTISIAFSLFMIAWNTKDLSKNSFFLIFGIASLFVGFFDLLHTLSYKGMNIFTEYSTNLPTQLWILARYMKSISLFIAFLALNKKINEKITFLLYFTISFLFLISIFYLRIFPDCYIEGKGLTPFKIISEYIISIIFLFSLLFLFLNKKDFDKKVFYYIFFSIIVTILREFFFTLYVDVFGIFNLIGHFLKLISYYLIYKAFIEIGLKNPYSILFKKLDEKNKDLKQIINTLSHDLRSPLTTIGGFTDEINKCLKTITDILEKKGIKSGIDKEINSIIKNEIHEYYNYIKLSITKIKSLISGLTSLSKVEKITINYKKIDMNMLIKTIIGILKYQINEKNINVMVDDLPECKSDELQLNEVFSNLIGNAIKYSDEKKKGMIKISGEKYKNRIIYCIEDNGIGIPKKYQENIFDLFFRIDSHDKGGDGLGLAIVKKIIEKLNGKIYFESEEGIGSKFFVSLPMIK